MDKIQSILAEVSQHDGDIGWLAQAQSDLAVLLYNLGTEVAEAELAENQAIVAYLESQGEAKKMAVSEAEKRGLIDTQNSYGILKLAYQSTVENIQSLKKRVDWASQQMKSGI